MPFTTSTEVAKAWEVDHNALCGKLLGHRRRKWMDANPPRSSTSGTWGPRSTYAPLGVALMPVWANQSIAYVQRNLGGRKHHPRHVGPRGQDAGLPKRASSRGRRCPLSWTNGLTIGPPGTTAPWALPSPRDPRRRPPANGAQPVALARGKNRSSCNLAPSGTRPCAGRNCWHGVDPAGPG